ncbi:MAG: tripartite tricarboxylate transporter substrate binding protein [Betaproteobacteria bacterium]
MRRAHGRGSLARTTLCATIAIATLVAGGASGADSSFPNRAVRIVAAQQPGSATDNVARLVADALETHWGVAVAVENRAGAGGMIGAEYAARAHPDGYTLLVGGTSNLVIAAAANQDIRYDPAKDFVAVGRVAHVPFVYAVHPAVPAHTLRELADLARAQPGKLSYVTLGATSAGFGMVMFQAQAGVEMLAVDYKGISSAIPDVLSGRVDALFNEVASLTPHAQAGRLRLLAVAGPRRIGRLPDVPTTSEQGYPNLVIAPWYGLLAPAGTPPEVIERLRAAYEAIMRSPVVRTRIEALGYEPIDDAPGQFATALRDDIAAMRTVAKASTKAPAR